MFSLSFFFEKTLVLALILSLLDQNIEKKVQSILEKGKKL